jgi:peptide/nickel transport system substrate-binding protein
MVLLVSTPAFAATAQQVQGPRYGGTAVMDLTASLHSLNPAHQYDDMTLRVANVGFYDRLVGITEPGFGSKLFPVLAQSWEVSPDARVYTFHLYKNVTWHDGVKFTSADVKWTVDQIIGDKGAAGHDYVTDVQSVTTPDDYTVVITLNHPNAAFLVSLAIYWFPGILPKHLYDGTDWHTNPYNEHPVGTGPFKFVEWVKGDHVTVEANEKYHLGRPYLDKIIIRFIPDMANSMVSLEKGESIWSWHYFPYAQAVAWKQNPNLRVYILDTNIMNWMAFNIHRKPYDDVRVRQAIAYAINRTEVNERAFLGLARPAKGIFLSNALFYDPTAKLPEYDPNKAEQLLDQAGYPRGPDGVRFKTTLLLSGILSWTDMAPVIREDLKKVGIDVTLNVVEFPTLIDLTCTRHNFDLALSGAYHGPDPNEWLNYVTTGAYRNSMNYSNPHLDDLFAKARSTFDEKTRFNYYSEIQHILANDMVHLSLIEYNRVTAVNNKYHGFFFEPDGQPQGYSLQRLVWWEGGTPTVGTSSTSVAQPPGGGIPVSSYVAVALVAIVIIAAGAFALRRRKSTKAP